MATNWVKLKYKLLAAINPRAWVRNNRTDLAWDKELWEMLDRGEIEYVGSHQVIIGKYKVWIENYPYASGVTISDKGETLSCSRSTALFLNSQLPAARIVQRLKGLDYSHMIYRSKDGQHIC